jgi:hypothetical protein
MGLAEGSAYISLAAGPTGNKKLKSADAPVDKEKEYPRPAAGLAPGNLPCILLIGIIAGYYYLCPVL